MKTTNLLVIIILASITSLGQSDSLTWDARTRYYEIHVPPSYDGNAKVELIVAMHGGFGSGTQLETQSKLSEKSDAEGFIVVYPDGVKSLLGIRTWNAGGCCGYSMDNDIDDVGFINTLLDSMIQDYNIDTDKIYATGMSNGAFMSYRLACEIGDRFAAIAPVAGTMNVPNCTSGNKTPVIHFHSVLDGSVPHQGGIGNGPSNHYNPPLDSVFNVWKSKNSCGKLDTLQNDASFMHVKWSDCFCGNSNELYLTQDGGHSWHGGKKTFSGDDVSTVVNANDKMWDFFQSVSACSVGIIETEKNQIKTYPNPCSKGQPISIEFKNDIPQLIEVYNTMGKLIYSKTPKHKNIQLTIENSGMYIIKIQNRNSSYSNIELIVYD